MNDHKWKKEALEKIPFELTPDLKKQITETSPWATIPEVEKICSGYLYWRSKFDTKDTKKETLQNLDGTKNETGIIEKLQKCSDANKELWKALYNVSEWLPGHQADAIRDGMKQTIPHIDMMLKKMKDSRNCPTYRSQMYVPEYYLIDALADIYFKSTGKEVTRNNPYGLPSESPLIDIIQILDGVLDCGPCTGHIKKIIRTRKEISDLDL